MHHRGKTVSLYVRGECFIIMLFTVQHSCSSTSSTLKNTLGRSKRTRFIVAATRLRRTRRATPPLPTPPPPEPVTILSSPTLQPPPIFAWVYRASTQRERQLHPPGLRFAQSPTLRVRRASLCDTASPGPTLAEDTSAHFDSSSVSIACASHRRRRSHHRTHQCLVSPPRVSSLVYLFLFLCAPPPPLRVSHACVPPVIDASPLRVRAAIAPP